MCAASFDHLVGAGKHCWWNGEAESLRGLEIDGQLELGRRLYRQVGGFGTFQDTVDILGKLPVHIFRISPVICQSAARDEAAKGIDRRQSVPSCQRANQVAMQIGAVVWQYKKAAFWLVRKITERTFNVGGVAKWKPDRLDGQHP